MTAEKQSRFRIEIIPSRILNGHEVLFFADDMDLLDFFGDGNVGLDPPDVLTDNSQLRVRGEPHEALIGLCGCGCPGCGDLDVHIQGDGEQVIWTGWDGSKRVTFSADQYEAEIERAAADHSWETPMRTAERLVGAAIDREVLARYGFKFQWASGSSTEGMMTVSLELSPGPYQVLVRIPWNDPDTEKIVSSFCALLSQHPNTWTPVDCYPQAKGLPPPPFTGPAWA